jgi:protein phosphatase
MGADSPEFREMFDTYMQCFVSDSPTISSADAQVTLPIFRKEQFIRLFTRVQSIFHDEPTLLEVTSPCIIVGDIHGQLADLARILLSFGSPPDQSYVFLGDLVDRGEFSLECVAVIFLMKVIAPDAVSIVRGNHEFQGVCSGGGFLTEVVEEFGVSSPYQSALRAFAQIPLGAVIDGTTLCIHGGLSPGLESLQQIRRIERPINEYDQEIIMGLVWSDPSSDLTGFARSTVRGVGYVYGEDVTENFLTRNHLARIVRGHECITAGIEEKFGGRVVTVFSASNYCGTVNNSGAILEILPFGDPRPCTFPPLPWKRRCNAKHKVVVLAPKESARVPRSLRMARSGNVTSSTGNFNPAWPLGRRLTSSTNWKGRITAHGSTGDVRLSARLIPLASNLVAPDTEVDVVQG